MELVCPAGSFPALKAAVDNGADTVYFGLQRRNQCAPLQGTEFRSTPQGREGDTITPAARGVKVLLCDQHLPATTPAGRRGRQAVDMAAGLGVNALIAADMGVLGYAAERGTPI